MLWRIGVVAPSPVRVRVHVRGLSEARVRPSTAVVVVAAAFVEGAGKGVDFDLDSDVELRTTDAQKHWQSHGIPTGNVARRHGRGRVYRNCTRRTHCYLVLDAV